MAKCNCCSAPLLADTNRCIYCNVRNDVDLQGKHAYTIATKHSARVCPHCVKPLQTIKLNINGPFHIERCKTCFGLFFDVGEIETLLENATSNVFDINRELIKNINQDRYQSNKKVKYIKCPVCRNFMNRVNYAHKSGVVVDRCKKHGVWLDSGEISHLLEWKKAGGELLHAKNEKFTNTRKKTSSPASYNPPIHRQHFKTLEPDLLETVSSLVVKLFN